MYFHLNRAIYLTYFNNEAIILDLREDRYIIFQKNLSTYLKWILQKSFLKQQDCYVPENPDLAIDEVRLNEVIKKLREEKVISYEDFFEPSSQIFDENTTKGLSHHEWLVPSINMHEKVSIRLVLESFFILIKVHIFARWFGFSYLISALRKKSGKKFFLQKSKTLTSSQMTKSVRLAYLFFPVRMKCLEWAASLVFLGLKKGKKCRLMIGVQRFPFIAHAWAEDQNYVIGDAQSLPSELAIILQEPS